MRFYFYSLLFLLLRGLGVGDCPRHPRAREEAKLPHLIWGGGTKIWKIERAENKFSYLCTQNGLRYVLGIVVRMDEPE